MSFEYLLTQETFWEHDNVLKPSLREVSFSKRDPSLKIGNFLLRAYSHQAKVGAKGNTIKEEKYVPFHYRFSSVCMGLCPSRTISSFTCDFLKSSPRKTQRWQKSKDEKIYYLYLIWVIPCSRSSHRAKITRIITKVINLPNYRVPAIIDVR